MSFDKAKRKLTVLAAESIRYLELRSAWGTNVADLSDDQLTTFLALLADAGVGVSAIGSPIHLRRGQLRAVLPVA